MVLESRWQTYRDFTIKVTPAPDGRYCVEAQGSAGEARVICALPFDDRDIQIFFLQVGVARRAFRGGRVPEPVQATVEFGRKLYDAVISGEVRDTFVRARQEAERQGTGLRVKLRLADAPELADLPWEFLYDGHDFLALSAGTALVRYLDLPRPPRPMGVTLPLRILVTVSAPHDLPAFDLKAEQDKVREALAALQADGLVELTFLPDVTLQAFQRTLRRARRDGRPYHVWHHIGHGAFDRALGSSVLFFCDAAGVSSAVSGFQLGTLFSGYPELRLALLNTCEGARPDRTDPFAGVAAALVERGLPAVIGMQFEISDQAAIAFSEEFYTSLADGLPVDAAVAEARRAVFFMPNWVEWAKPVLYMRAPDGVLFDLQAQEKVERVHRDPEADSPAPGKQEGVVRQEKQEPPRPTSQASKQKPKTSSAVLRIHQRINEAQQRWELLSKRIEAVTRDLALSLDGERQVVLQESLAALKKERDEIEAELDRLEKELALSHSNNEEAKTSSSTQVPARQPVEPEMILIPAGEFLMGDDRKKVSLPDYYIAKTPVTNAQYQHFVRAGGTSPGHWRGSKIPDGQEQHPVDNVSWHDAVAYCQWLSEMAKRPYRLPTEQEWEKAARGTDGRAYPWGNKWRDGLCNTSEARIGDTTPVGRYSPAGDSPYGVADMAGNVWEWTDSWYDRERVYRVVRGGSWYYNLDHAQCTSRFRYYPDYGLDLLGFRCVSPISLS